MAAPGSKILKVGIEIGGSVGKSLDAAIRQTRASIGGLGKGLNDIAGAGKAGLGRVLASPLWQGGRRWRCWHRCGTAAGNTHRHGL